MNDKLLLCFLSTEFDVTISGGPSYGSLYQPVQTGSTGGPGTNGVSGGKGGGKAKITVGSIMVLDGSIEANGGVGSSWSGGGSGGSVWIITSKNVVLIFLKIMSN